MLGSKENLIVMESINNLILKYCPNGCEYRKLGGETPLVKVTSGEFVHKSKQRDDGQYPVYNGGKSNTGYYDDYNTEANKVIVSARGAGA